MALLMSVESLSGKRVIWLEPRAEGLLNILVGKGRKMSAEEIGKGGGEFISVVKFDLMGMMSEY